MLTRVIGWKTMGLYPGIYTFLHKTVMKGMLAFCHLPQHRMEDRKDLCASLTLTIGELPRVTLVLSDLSI